MSEVKITTWMVFICAVIALVLLLSGPLAYKYGVFPLGQAMGSTLVAFFLADAVLLVALFLLYRSTDADINRQFIMASIGLSILPVVMMSLQIYKAMTVPPIHDISTDTSNPPVFDQIAEIRQYVPNPLTYGTEDMPVAQLVQLQSDNYPEIKSLSLPGDKNTLLSKAEAALTEMGIEVVSRNDAMGIVEGTAETFWFGFKDDVVVRVSESSGDGAGYSTVDVRSISRVGKSDLGTNAARVKKVLDLMSE